MLLTATLVIPPPPFAVKVAGMRITQNKVTHHDKPEPKVEKKEGEEEDEAVVEAPPKVVLSVSGAIARVRLLSSKSMSCFVI